ncbi:hypothetical protein E2C01_063661 [Portunus trituberculatus]|uniref:Uncharacterized protein n=1 Tax=Portunus trituberculatus TaxID=210409 RepID=A0A5B7HHN5_PORTR|nr:hypothetical protein [Portunus trituberculatus]
MVNAVADPLCIYIGSTITTLPKRITAHLQDGTIKKHHVTNHADTTFNCKKIEENTVIKNHAKSAYG